MNMKRKLLIIGCILAACHNGLTQQRFSIATDFSLLRSFKTSQKFWAAGQTVRGSFNFNPKDGAYVYVSYYSPGKFTNEVTAIAKSPATQPQELRINSRNQVSYRSFSIGYKRYLAGHAYSQESYNLYGYAGFGILIGNVENNYQLNPDTALYHLPVRPVPASGRFQRLTIDAAFGVELPIKGDLYFYLEGRSFIRTSNYPTPLLLDNEDAPVLGALNLGLRILF